MANTDSIERLEADLWAAADYLRANSKLTSSEYCMPVLGVIFLRHATNRYNAALAQIHAAQAAGKMPNRPLVKGDFVSRRALLLPKEARYDELPKDTNLGAALVTAHHSPDSPLTDVNSAERVDYFSQPARRSGCARRAGHRRPRSRR